MKTNINQELFKRYAPKKKLEIIESLTQEELLAITTSTITRMVKETGDGDKRSPDKYLRIRLSLRKGNNWNSWFEGIGLYKKKLYASLNIQYTNTDTGQCIPYSEFMADERFRGTIKTIDLYGNPQTYYYFYDNQDRARMVKSILLEYVNRKYLDHQNARANGKL